MLILKNNKEFKIQCSKKSYFNMHSKQKVFDYYYNFDKNIKTSDINYNAIWHNIQEINLNNFEKNKINILICVENCNYWKHYKHYNKFGNYANENIQIYFYNHIDKMVINDKYISIPIIYTIINHYNLFKNYIKPTIMTPFTEKKFCIFTSKWDYKNIGPILRKYGKCDHIKDFKARVGNKSLYFSNEILNLFNEYKFVFSSENSFTNGYITEKIFNIFFSKCIPIYLGPDDTYRYFNKNCFINANNKQNLELKIKEYSNNEISYNEILYTKKINENYNDENYLNKLNKFIKINL